VFVFRADLMADKGSLLQVKNVIFWDVMQCRYFVNRRFRGMYRLHLQDIRNPRAMNQREQVAVDYSSETSVNKISTLRHIPEDILHSHHPENLKSYMYFHCLIYVFLLLIFSCLILYKLLRLGYSY
jgi:hypothetical protein